MARRALRGPPGGGRRDRRRHRRVRVALAVPVPAGLRHDGRGLGLPARAGYQGRGIGRRLLEELVRLASAARVPRRDRPDHRRERRLDPAPRAGAASRSWAPSARSAGSSAGGSTWSRCSACCECKRPPARRAESSVQLVSGPGWIRTNVACAAVLQTAPFGHSGTDPGPRTVSGRQFPASSVSDPPEIDHAHLRRRVRARHAGGPQRRRPGVTRDLDPLRLQEHGQLHRAEGQGDRARHRERSAPHRAHAGARGEAGQAAGLAEGARLRQDRRGLEGRGAPDRQPQRRDLDRQGEGDRQVRQGSRAQGRVAPDPGRPAPGERQEARRPADQRSRR